MSAEPLAGELRRAALLRCKALEDTLSELRGSLRPGRQPLGRALELFTLFPPTAQRVIRDLWRQNPDAESRVQLLRPLLRHITDVASFVEEWLARGDQLRPTLSLLAAIRRESETLEVGSRQPVVALGPADNFRIVSQDIKALLFSPLGVMPRLNRHHQVRAYAFIQAPRYEGGDVLWHPIVLGHELAHLVVEARDSVPSLDLKNVFDFTRAGTFAVPGSPSDNPLDRALTLYKFAEWWAAELLCDANALRRFGPAALASLAEYLDTIGARDKFTPTHPTGRLRVSLLVDWMGPAPASALSKVTLPWSYLAAAATPHRPEWVDLLESLFASITDRLWSAVNAWPGDSYDWRGRGPVIEGVADALRKGVPGRQSVPVNGSEEQVERADVINAAWLGRVEGYRTPVDRLASKALDDLEFIERWREASGGPVVLAEPPNPTSGDAAVLSEQELLAEVMSDSPHTLAVTPLLPGLASGAAIDLRLGNRFIVFIRTSTESFDTLGRESDPRSMQRLIELEWGDRFVLHPNELVLAATLEYLVLPGNETAQVITRSSYGRLGLLTATAVQVHPHFHGCLTLELANLGTLPLVLTPGERIAQLVVSRVGMTKPPRKNKYFCGTGPEFSKIRRDRESTILRKLRQSSP